MLSFTCTEQQLVRFISGVKQALNILEDFGAEVCAFCEAGGYGPEGFDADGEIVHTSECVGVELLNFLERTKR